MMSGSCRKLLLVLLLTLLFVLWPGREASGITATTAPPERLLGQPGATAPLSAVEARVRLTQGFRQILSFFAQRDFSLLTAWREMRGSADPGFFERKYPDISRELDTWAASLEKQFGVPDESERSLDFTFLVAEFSPVALDRGASESMRDNALATICMVCVMDNLRCEPPVFHRFLSTVVGEDPSPARKTEALRWWRRTEGFIDESLLEQVLVSPAAGDLELRAEAARILFSIGTRRSLQAQRLLASTYGLPADPTGGQPQIACAAIRHFARAEFVEAIPDLIAALDDPSREVRACAAESLAGLTGRDFTFDPAADGPSNEQAIARWRAWWEQRASVSAGGGR